eukprot:841334-Rhodomonas_salina.1
MSEQYGVGAAGTAAGVAFAVDDDVVVVSWEWMDGREGDLRRRRASRTAAARGLRCRCAAPARDTHTHTHTHHQNQNHPIKSAAAAAAAAAATPQKTQQQLHVAQQVLCAQETVTHVQQLERGGS